MSAELRLMPPVLLTTDDVARRMNVSRRTVRTWCEEGKLRHFKEGRILRIYGDALAEALQRGRLTGGDQR